MRVFVAGATGALGIPVVRSLVAEGHEVVGLTRTPAKQHLLTDLGAHVVIGDALDAATVRSVVASSAPDAVVHALTAIPRRGPLRSTI
jgi:2-alkyl-3-oxoalkanoate reductase